VPVNHSTTLFWVQAVGCLAVHCIFWSSADEIVLASLDADI
jgi:hypothetical protein